MASRKVTDITKKIKREESTGTLLCVDDQGKLGRIYFSKGRASTARYDHLQGGEAFARIIQLQVNSTRFHEGRDMVRSKLAIQDSAKIAIPEQAISNKNAVENETVANSDRYIEEIAGSATSNQLTPESKKLLRDELAKHIGPVARIVIDNLDDQISLKDAVKTLATEIGERNAAINFVNAMKEKTYF